jgi:hypothetical protein
VHGEFKGDERGVEGMPIRLVVAVTVGIAAFSLLVPMAERVERTEQTEVTVESQPRQLTVEPGNASTARIDVVTTDDQPIAGATLVVSGRSAIIEGGPLVFETGDRHTLTLDIGFSSAADIAVAFRPTQERGTISVQVVPPSNSAYTDDLVNPEITIRRTDGEPGN